MKDVIDPKLYAAWKTIAKGEQLIKEGKKKEGQDLIWAGNGMILEYEQKNVLQKVYDKYPDAFRRQSGGVLNPVPPHGEKQCLPFLQFVPGGNISFFKDRWRWIKNAVLPDWRYVSENAPAKIERIIQGIAKGAEDFKTSK